MQSEESIGVVIMVINESRAILMGERKNSYKAGMYGLPGGRIKANESLIQAAQRELQEETGLTVTDQDLTYFGVIREFQKGYNFIHFAFLLNNPSQQPKNIEPNKCKCWEWISIENLPSKLLRGHKAAIEMWKNKTIYEDIL